MNEDIDKTGRLLGQATEPGKHSNKAAGPAIHEDAIKDFIFTIAPEV
jgi:hypothetical protein